MMNIQDKEEMKIILTPRAQEFLQHAGTNAISIEAIEIQQCCIPLTVPPVVRKGSPHKPEKFVLLQSDGYSIYFDKDLRYRPQITIDTKGIGFMKGLQISDWEIRY